MKVRAAVLEEFGAPLQVQQLDLAKPKTAEVLVRLVACGVCCRRREGQFRRPERADPTFTEVQAFGGGCVPFLNGILHLTAVPECAIAGLFGSTLVEQGATLDVTGLAPGIHRFECLIHPWMRTTVTVG